MTSNIYPKKVFSNVFIEMFKECSFVNFHDFVRILSPLNHSGKVLPTKTPPGKGWLMITTRLSLMMQTWILGSSSQSTWSSARWKPLWCSSWIKRWRRDQRKHAGVLTWAAWPDMPRILTGSRDSSSEILPSAAQSIPTTEFYRFTAQTLCLNQLYCYTVGLSNSCCTLIL